MGKIEHELAGRASTIILHSFCKATHNRRLSRIYVANHRDSGIIIGAGLLVLLHLLQLFRLNFGNGYLRIVVVFDFLGNFSLLACSRGIGVVLRSLIASLWLMLEVMLLDVVEHCLERLLLGSSAGGNRLHFLKGLRDP